MTDGKTNLTPFDKLQALLDENAADLSIFKKWFDAMKTRQKTLTKLLAKMKSKTIKPHKIKTNRKPCGFARPTPVSDDMCAFLSIAAGTEVSRTTVTRALIQYIKDKDLQNPSNKKQILPDETLYSIFGEEARNQTLTYFTMQKFVNHHFKPKLLPPV
jgi:upstream activation factor subunit UAF30